ncbi:hypothetical protein COX59_04605 [Candidatus Beckwithbacteria bacterium CG_4_10_14_0_2_um_filter_47_25]|uniref:Uncharacterized protein n=3 Tax=Candidatus Beckwithiibacteriota TaxID=1752726 RepID=A0A1J4RRM3_9BACT|nr:MAG: hypothetical protein AUJ59_01235 [Candidatus Beckwithbacteria bacterium CG1_02_47_37]PIP52067.1 MAG: hypothetical protein COX09_03625 [Candidatus Beckwithbacteria bacterium CG23_combo_of_CG06-09_8_20_14_all_47_9]PJA21275.1 MAG: hypothetical protein COX59_04605 [Candidatus Beckwithbacteria bacterium CG_4_10_14_0_2_um_filter_47_25]
MAIEALLQIAEQNPKLALGVQAAAEITQKLSGKLANPDLRWVFNPGVGIINSVLISSFHFIVDLINNQADHAGRNSAIITAAGAGAGLAANHFNKTVPLVLVDIMPDELEATAWGGAIGLILGGLASTYRHNRNDLNTLSFVAKIFATAGFIWDIGEAMTGNEGQIDGVINQVSNNINAGQDFFGQFSR